MKQIIHIDGMRCGHCTSSVEKALRAVAGVTDVQVDLESKTAAVTTNTATPDALRKAVLDTGFDVVKID